MYMDLTRATWRKSTFSGNNGGQCVEIATVTGHVVVVRDSKNPHGPVLALTPEGWQGFTHQVKADKNLLA
ncbi:MAG TPA: DUF397 domain-containing protein [Streptosporangiaceae bacterium]|jgi:hypothetical protein|nr:DUF397 domain-containing protein [Streptosporangiaceae bacterium]